MLNEDVIINYTLYLREQNITDVTIRTYLTNLRAFIYYCIRKNYVDNFTIKIPRVVEKIKEVYTDNDLTLLLKKPNTKKCNFSEYRNWMITNFLLGTAIRIETLCNIKIENIDFENSEIILKQVKTKKQYYIPLSVSLIPLLQEYLDFRKGNLQDYLFCNMYGGKLAVDSLQSAIWRYNKRRGVNKTSLHLYRHTFAKNWIINGGSIYELQRILGHKTLEMVKRYANIYGSDLKINFDKYNPLNKYTNIGKHIKLH